jgi:hypothetical protein
LSQKIEKTALLKSSTVSKLRESFGFILTVGEQFYLPSTCRKKTHSTSLNQEYSNIVSQRKKKLEKTCNNIISAFYITLHLLPLKILRATAPCAFQFQWIGRSRDSLT